MTPRIVELPALFPHQREILLDNHRVKVPCVGRQGGKSLMGRVAALRGHGRLPDGRPKFRGALSGGNIYWVTKDYPTATLIWHDLNVSLRRWSGQLDVSKSDYRIRFPGDGCLTVKSGSDPDAMRGPTIDGLVGDETAFWHPDTLSTLEPAMAVRRAWRILISTPFGFNFYYEEWKMGCAGDPRKHPDYRSWHLPSSANPAFSQEEFEEKRQRVNPSVFAREYLAEFAVQYGDIFKSEWFRFYDEDDRMIYPELGPSILKADLQVFLTADFALTKQTYSDYTVVAAWGYSRDGRIFALEMVRARIAPGDIPDVVKRMQDRHGAQAVHVEKSGPLVGLNAECRQKGVRIVEHGIHGIVDGKKGWDKVTRGGIGAAAVQVGRMMFPRIRTPDGGTVRAPWVADLISECTAFPTKGIPDDRVDALSWAAIAAPNRDNAERRVLRAPDRTLDDDGSEGTRPRWIIGR